MTTLYNRNTAVLLDEPMEEEEDLGPLSLTTTTVLSEKEKKRETKDLKKKEKKQKSRLEKTKEKNKEKAHRDLKEKTKGRLSWYNWANPNNTNPNALEKASELLEESERLMDEVNELTNQSDALNAASQDDETFVQKMNTIKAQQQAKKDAERNGFLQAKKRKEEKKKKRNEKEKLQKDNAKVDHKTNFKKREKEHKAKLRQKKEEEKTKKKAAKEQKKLEQMAEQDDNTDVSPPRRRSSLAKLKRLSNGLGLFKGGNSKNKQNKRESIRTKLGVEERTDVLNLWGVEPSKKI